MVMKRFTMKIASIVMAAVLVVSMTPVPALADGGLVAASPQAVTAQGAPKQAQTEKTAITAKMATVKNLTYTGKAQAAKVTVKVGKKTLKQGRDYTLVVKTSKGKKCSGNKVKAKGAYKAVVKGKGSYKGTVTKSFKVVAKKTSKVKLTASMVSVKDLTRVMCYPKAGDTAYGYSGRFDHSLAWYGQKPNLTVKHGGETLKAGRDYTYKVAYPYRFWGRADGNLLPTDGDRVYEPGRYIVQVFGKGSYTGKIAKAFNVNAETKKVGSTTYTRQWWDELEPVTTTSTETYYDWCEGCEQTRTVTKTEYRKTRKSRWVKFDPATFASDMQSATRNSLLPYYYAWIPLSK